METSIAFLNVLGSVTSIICFLFVFPAVLKKLVGLYNDTSDAFAGLLGSRAYKRAVSLAKTLAHREHLYSNPSLMSAWVGYMILRFLFFASIVILFGAFTLQTIAADPGFGPKMAGLAVSRWFFGILMPVFLISPFWVALMDMDRIASLLHPKRFREITEKRIKRALKRSGLSDPEYTMALANLDRAINDKIYYSDNPLKDDT